LGRSRQHCGIGPKFARYGGNTICIEMRCGKHTLLFDAGSGLRPAGKALRASEYRFRPVFHLATRSHHRAAGFPPMYERGIKHALVGHLAGRMTTRQMVDAFIQPPWFPVKWISAR
jgi:phosphoribosyl 1,2-cyclic phosphodiesterase